MPAPSIHTSGRTSLPSPTSLSSGEPCQHHSPSKLLPVQSLTALKSRNQKFIIPAVNGKNYWVCTNTAGGIHLLWSCTLLGLTALLQKSYFQFILEGSSLHQLILLYVSLYFLLHYGVFPGGNLRETSQRHRACTDLWEHSYFWHTQEFPLQLPPATWAKVSCEETPLLYPPGMTALLKYCIPTLQLPSLPGDLSSVHLYKAPVDFIFSSSLNVFPAVLHLFRSLFYSIISFFSSNNTGAGFEKLRSSMH